MADGPLLVQVGSADPPGPGAPGSFSWWFSGDVVNGQLSLETPSDVLQRIAAICAGGNMRRCAHRLWQPEKTGNSGNILYIYIFEYTILM